MRDGRTKKLQMLGVEDVRDTNEMRFLHLIRNHQPISRAELVKATGLRAGTVSVVINRMLRAGFILEGEEAPSSGGRRATYLEVNAEKAYALAISIGVRQTAYAVSDFKGRILTQRAIPTESEPESFLNLLSQDIEGHLQTHYGQRRPEAVGVSIPGLVDRDEGRVVVSPNLGWVDTPVRRMLEQQLALPVFIENDANAAALSELWYGRFDALSGHSLVFVLVVEGVGTGVILNGELHVGTRIGLGGFGHMQLDPHGPRCSCGNAGCWEAMASDDATVGRFLKSRPERCGTVPSVHDVIALAHAGDPDARQALLETASCLGQGMRGLAQGLAPEVIVVGGEITRLWNLIEPVLDREIQSGYLIPGVSRPQVRRASVDQPSLLGAISIALRGILKRRKRLAIA
jgi:predicted NBD/HSP70 family sugar kinase